MSCSLLHPDIKEPFGFVICSLQGSPQLVKVSGEQGYSMQIRIFWENLAAKCFKEIQSGSETILAILTVQFFTKDPNTRGCFWNLWSYFRQFAKIDSHQKEHWKVKIPVLSFLKLYEEEWHYCNKCHAAMQWSLDSGSWNGSHDLSTTVVILPITLTHCAINQPNSNV